MGDEIPVHRFVSAREAPALCGAYIEIDGYGMTCCAPRDAPEHEKAPMPVTRVTYANGGVVVVCGPDCGCIWCRQKEDFLFRSPAGNAGVEDLPVGVPPDEDDPADRRTDRAIATGVAVLVVLMVALFLLV